MEEEIAKCAYEAFIESARPFLPAAEKPWRDLPLVLRQAWIDGIRAAFARIGITCPET